MARNVQVLLIENVDGTGIVGDVVQVRKGFARNFLLPRGMAETPSEAKIAQLQTKRKEAIKALGELRKNREALIGKLVGQAITLVRSCNDLGILYAAITQHEIAAELAKAGFAGIADREVRLGQPIKRVGEYAVTIKFILPAIPDEAVAKAKTSKKATEVDSNLEAEVKVTIKPDRELNLGRRDDAPSAEAAAMAEVDAAAAGKGEARGEGKKGEGKPKSDKKDAGDKPAKAEKAEKADKAEKAPKAEKADKPAKGDKAKK